ncbi:glutamyl-tRNA reductase [Nostocoides sp. F2B08]|uniref:glutamyl-tRNA reductase n=1 Tax=Nostocoides sp. F2B08 TaxID=2653936 RepID=UPI001262E9B9|nr:glutamyl-tRNA reductase [Tetrasphaera sp. F2B08]KAB7746453.1 glutamyl-tRNA reductase [Tetrasphaera sp. F2B08]
MTLLVVGVSHLSAPLPILESVALDEQRRHALETALHGTDHIEEVVVLSTCNRTELYVEAATFHGALEALTGGLSALTGVGRSTLRDHLYIHYDDRAVEHAFTVAAGLDSMAVGETQILGQLRAALARAQDRGHVGPALNVLLQQSLRVGKRIHTDTAIDAVSHSLVEAGLAVAEDMFGTVDGLRTLVIGAGGMGALAATTAQRQGALVTVTNRTLDRAQRLAARVDGTARPVDELDKALAEADVVIASTGAMGAVVTLPQAVDAQVARAGRPQLYVDLALPHDVATEVDALTGVRRLGLDELGSALAATTLSPAVDQARGIVVAEVEQFLAARAGDAVGPTVTALRDHAAGVVSAELVRLWRRTPDLSDAQRAEVDRTVHRIVDKLLHTPTTRVRELAGAGESVSYAAALSDLFDLPGPTHRAGTRETLIAADVPDRQPGAWS